MKTLAFILLAISVLVLGARPTHAAVLVAKGSKATLNVEYVYESAGSRSEGKYESGSRQSTWNLKRTFKVTVPMVAQEPTDLGSVLGSGQDDDRAALKEKETRGNRAAEAMAPVQADMMKLVEKCGEDAACMQREMMKNMSGEGGQRALKAKKAAEPDIAAVLQRGPMRYQFWTPAAPGSRTFNIHDEKQERWLAMGGGEGSRAVPCTSGAVAVGEGRLVPDAVAVASVPKGIVGEGGGIQFDSKAKTLTLTLPGVIGTPSPLTPLKQTHSGNCSGSGFPSLNTGIETGPWLIKFNGEQVAQQGSRIIGGKSDGSTLTIRWSLQPL